MPTLREIQLFELQMLKDVVKVCDDNNITYIISSGTLLGAVRHGGFIPWDDDIDIDMPLSDYKKFLKIAQRELGEKYFVQNYKTDKNYSEMWTQIRANGTTSMPVKDYKYKIHFGMCMDIFPLVGVSNDHKKRNKQKKALALNRMLLHDTYAKALDEPISSKLKLIYAIPRGIRRLICRINEHNIMLDPNKFEDCCELWYSMDAVPAQSTSIFHTFSQVKFEDAYFNTYGDYKAYLSNMYGDYMTPPPKNERDGHVDTLGDIIFDLNKDYSEYQKELSKS
jgi:lipopolysaccharide cholinephosphotransferase